MGETKSLSGRDDIQMRTRDAIFALRQLANDLHDAADFPLARDVLDRLIVRGFAQADKPVTLNEAVVEAIMEERDRAGWDKVFLESLGTALRWVESDPRAKPFLTGDRVRLDRDFLMRLQQESLLYPPPGENDRMAWEAFGDRFVFFAPEMGFEIGGTVRLTKATVVWLVTLLERPLAEYNPTEAEADRIFRGSEAQSVVRRLRKEAPSELGPALPTVDRIVRTLRLVEEEERKDASLLRAAHGEEPDDFGQYEDVIVWWNALPKKDRQRSTFLKRRMEAEINMGQAAEALETVKQWRTAVSAECAAGGRVFICGGIEIVEIRALGKLKYYAKSLKAAARMLERLETVCFTRLRSRPGDEFESKPDVYAGVLRALADVLAETCEDTSASEAAESEVREDAVELAHRLLSEGRAFLRWYPVGEGEDRTRVDKITGHTLPYY